MLYTRISLAFICCFILATAHGQEEERVILSEKNVENAYPRLSADQQKILYQSNRTGNWQLYILQIATGNSQRITDDKYDNNFPDWSTDNKHVAFVSNRDGNEELYIMNTDGTGLRRLTNNTDRDIHPYFSPDGKYLLFNSTRGNKSLDIFRYELATGKIDQLTNTKDHETCARYSADMKRIVFLRNNDETDDVYTMSLSNGLTENISNTPYIQDGWPMFSRRDEYIYYSSLTDGKYSIYRIALNSGIKEQLTTAQPGEEDARVCVAQDESLIVYNKRAGRTIDIRIKTL